MEHPELFHAIVLNFLRGQHGVLAAPGVTYA
jgi:hypothetical protein